MESNATLIFTSVSFRCLFSFWILMRKDSSKKFYTLHELIFLFVFLYSFLLTVNRRKIRLLFNIYVDSIPLATTLGSYTINTIYQNRFVACCSMHITISMTVQRKIYQAFIIIIWRFLCVHWEIVKNLMPHLSMIFFKPPQLSTWHFYIFIIYTRSDIQQFCKTIWVCWGFRWFM